MKLLGFVQLESILLLLEESPWFYEGIILGFAGKPTDS